MSVLLVVPNPKLDQFPACSTVLEADIKQETWENSVMFVCGKDVEERAPGVCCGMCSLLEKGYERQTVQGNFSL